eukprot:TRINITY_DN42937_c0_g1_i2.p2 TRINITY_DN42937_c0_g1~~TRINITY_DN42937_c0_g1_i2.p2  ORF type:complete len:279 (+),score=79.53 TRINITY_DN42937_c0_g1_i2:628-1464(+)
MIYGGLLVGCMGALLCAELRHHGGAWDAAATAAANARSLGTGAQHWGAGDAWRALDAFATASLGGMLSQEIVARLLAADSTPTARRSCCAAALLYVAVVAVPVFLGLLEAGAAGGDQLLPRLAAERLGPTADAVAQAALIGVVLTTLDSALLAAAAIIRAILGPSRRGGGAGSIAAAGAGATALALCGDSVFALVESAAAVGNAGTLPAVLIGLCSPSYGGAGAAVASAIGGEAVHGCLRWGYPSFPAPFSAAAAAAGLIYAGVAALEPTRAPGPKRD